MAEKEMTKGILMRHPASATNNDFLYMTLPLYVVAIYMNGARPLILAVIAFFVAELCDRVVTAISKAPYDKTENSSKVFALITVLMLPASVPYHVAITAVLSAVLIGKWAFGGYGLYIFTPPAVGYTVAAISWPGAVFTYPAPLTNLPIIINNEVMLSDGALVALEAGGLPHIDALDLVLGNYPSSMGVASAFVILACFAFLWIRKRISLIMPLTYMLSCFAIFYLFPRYLGIGASLPWDFVQLRLLSAFYEMFSGFIFFAATFMINDEVTAPKRLDSKIIYAVFIAVFTVIFRYFGAYNTGACFAIISINVIAAPLDRWMSAAFGKYKKPHGAKAFKTEVE